MNKEPILATPSQIKENVRQWQKQQQRDRSRRANQQGFNTVIPVAFRPFKNGGGK